MELFSSYKRDLFVSSPIESIIILIFYILIVFFFTRWFITPHWVRFKNWFYRKCHQRYHRKNPYEYHCSDSIKCQSCAYLKTFDQFILFLLGLILVMFLFIVFTSTLNGILYISYLSSVRII